MPAFGVGFGGHGPRGALELVDAAVYAEHLGFDDFWVGDTHWGQDAFAVLAAAAASTETVGLATRVAGPHIRHPAHTAALAATVQRLAGGRFTLGMGAGGSGLHQVGLPRDEPAPALQEAIALIRRLLSTDEPFDADGRFTWQEGAFTASGRTTVPVVVAARGPRMLTLAGKVADGVLIASGATPAAVAWAREQIGSDPARAGPELLHNSVVAIGEPEAARTAARRSIVSALLGSHPTYAFMEPLGVTAPPGLRSAIEERRLDDATRLVPDDLIDAMAMTGEPDTIRRRSGELLDAGIEHLVFSISLIDGQSPADAMQLLADSVVTPLRALEGSDRSAG